MHTTIVTIPAMIASFILVSFLVFYALYLVYVYLNIISFVAIISLNDNLKGLKNLYPVNINKNITFSSGTATVSLGYTITKCYLAIIPIWNTNNFSGIASVSSDGNLTIKGYSGNSGFTGTQWLNIIGLVKRS